MTSPENAISLAIETRIDELCDQFEETWCSTDSQAIEQLLDEFVSEPDRSLLFRRLLEVDLELFARGDTLPNEADYQRRFPEHAEAIADIFRQLRASQVQSAAARGEAPTISISPTDTASVHSNLTPTIPIPTQIGRFEVVEVLGRGGFGTVYRARDPRMGRDVAIKVPGAIRLPTPADAQRFLREAKAAAALRHANICAVHEIGEDNGHPFIVMDYIAGEALSTILERGERLPVERIVQIIRELALALECVHQQKIIHRDLKPANVIIDSTGTPVIMDFGLARLQESDDNTITLGGDILGTPAYMPLEQARGDVQAIGPASDVYSLGAILYELLCGRRPYHSSGRETICQILHAAPPRPSAHDPQVNRKLEAICLKAMARNAAQRYLSMAEFAAALSKFSAALNDNRRSMYRRAGWVAAAFLFVAIAGTVTYIRTDQGWLEIESHDENVQLVVTQDGREVTIVDTKTQSRVRLHSGEYEIKLQGNRNDVTLSRSRFAMTRNHREIVSVQREATIGSAPVRVEELVPTTPPSAAEVIQVVRAQGHGKWRVDNGVLSCAQPSGDSEDWLLVGSPTWTDYDFSVWATSASPLKGHGPGVLFRSLSKDKAYYVAMNVFKSSQDYIDEYDGSHRRSSWNDHTIPRHVGKTIRDWSGNGHEIKVSVRGVSARISVNGELILSYDKLRHAAGYVGVRLHKDWPSQFRNPKVTAPDGTVLLDGWPELPPEIAATDGKLGEGVPDVNPETLEQQTARVLLPQYSESPVIEAGELRGSATPDKHFEIRLGDFEWHDYDVHVEYLCTTGRESFLWLKSNPDGKQRWDLSLGGWGPTNLDLRAVVDGETWWTSPARRWCPNVLSGRTDKWHSLDVRLRGTRVTVRLDGREVASSEHPRITKGCVGMAFTDGRWRNLTVTDPDGKLLWEGFADVSPRQDPPATKDEPASSGTDSPTAPPTDN